MRNSRHKRSTPSKRISAAGARQGHAQSARENTGDVGRTLHLAEELTVQTNGHHDHIEDVARLDEECTAKGHEQRRHLERKEEDGESRERLRGRARFCRAR